MDGGDKSKKKTNPSKVINFMIKFYTHRLSKHLLMDWRFLCINQPIKKVTHKLGCGCGRGVGKKKLYAQAINNQSKYP